MNRILVGLDSSSSATLVLYAAIDLALATGANISLLHVLEDPDERLDTDQASIAASERRLRELARDVPSSQFESARAVTGIVWEELCRAADGVDLVVVGARRYGSLDRALGTTASKLVHHCDRSLLAVRQCARPVEKILVALDGSDRAPVVREYAVALAKCMKAKLHLFQSVDLPSTLPTEALVRYATTEAALRDAAEKVLGAHDDLVPAELRAGVSASNGEEAWLDICNAARDCGADLIVIGSHGFHLTDRLLGSTAAKVVNHSDRAVLVVRRPWS